MSKVFRYTLTAPLVTMLYEVTKLRFRFRWAGFLTCLRLDFDEQL